MDLNIKLTLTATDIFGQKLDIDQCREILSEINLNSAIYGLALIKNMNERVFWNIFDDNPAKAEIHLLILFRYLFSKQSAIKASKMYEMDPQGFRPLSDQAILAMLVLVCQTCPVDGKNDLQNDSVREEFFKVLLSLQDNSFPDDFLKDKKGWDDLTAADLSFFLKNVYANKVNDNYRFSNCRLYSIVKYTEIGEYLYLKTGLNLKMWFNKYFDLDPEEYLKCAFLMGCLGRTLDVDQPDAKDLIFDPTVYFREKIITRFPILKDFIELASYTPSEIVNNEPICANLYEQLYTAISPVLRPIVKMKKQYICFSNNLILNKFFFGLPYLVLESYKSKMKRNLTNSEVKNLRGQTGYIFEGYVIWLFKNWFEHHKNIKILKNYEIVSNGSKKERDLLLINKKIAYVFEIKSKLQTLALRTTGDIREIQKALNEVTDQAYTAAKSIYEDSNLRKKLGLDEIIRVVPCVLTYDLFLLTYPLSEIFEQETCKSLGKNIFESNKSILPVQYFDITDIETSELYFDLNKDPEAYLNFLQNRAINKEIRYSSIGNIQKTMRADYKSKPGFLDSIAEDSRKYLDKEIRPLLFPNSNDNK